MELVLRLCVYGVIGLGMEVLFSSLADMVSKRKRDRIHLRGYSSFYYFPLYGFALPWIVYFAHQQMTTQFWVVRGFVYAVLILIGEFIAMALLHFINGASPSEKEYKASGRSIMGFVRWDFLPAYAIPALLFEYLMQFLPIK